MLNLRTKQFKGSSILITGGTGSFGRAFADRVLKSLNPRRLIIFSRDEMKQWEMAKYYSDDPRLRFFIGDVRDLDRLRWAFKGVDYVVHAAATKIVPTAEYNPFECVKTNVEGARNVIEASVGVGVKRVVALSTDKASSPVNLYGATKLVSDRLFVAANAFAGNESPIFSVVRYGNVMGSRGSVIPFFIEAAKKGSIPITDRRMTRFMITLEQGVDLVLHAFENSVGGELYIKKIPSMNIMQIAEAVDPEAKLEFIGIRPGEKLHEEMIGLDDALYTYEYDSYFKILPSIYDWYLDPLRIQNGVKVGEGFKYSSDSNVNWLKVDELRTWISNYLGHRER